MQRIAVFFREKKNKFAQKSLTRDRFSDMGTVHIMSRRRDHGAIALTYCILAALLVALALAGPAFVHHPSSALSLMGHVVISGILHSKGSRSSCSRSGEHNPAAALGGGRGEHAPAAQHHTSRRSMLLGASLQLIGVQAVLGARGAAASVREFTLDGETFLEVEFSPNEPLGLDLQETQAVTSTFPRVAVKVVRPGTSERARTGDTTAETNRRTD